MTEAGIEGKVQGIAGPIIESMGMELVDVEYRREQAGLVLRLYIDKEGGVNLDDCSDVSREVGTAIEVEDIIEHHYNLEVSSPGLTRPLKKLTDFERFKGSYVRLKLYAPVDGAKTLVGRLEGVDGGDISIDIDGNIMKIKYDDIAKANLEFRQEE